MGTSNLPGWIALITFAIAIGTLLRARFGSGSDDAVADVVTEWSAAFVASSMLGSLPRLFGFDSDIVHWATDAVALALGVFACVQIRRQFRIQRAQRPE